MKINDRLTKIESLQRSRMLPAPTLIWVVYEPSEAGPREVGAFTRIRSSEGIQPCGGTKMNAKTILKLELNFTVCINKLYIKVYMARLTII